MAKITTALMKKIAPTVSPALRDELTLWLNFYMPKYEITTELRCSAFFANFMEECARFSRFEENLNYSARRLMQVWPRRFPTLSIANSYAHNPKKLANYVYGGRNGNRPGTDDGWTYRGGGAGQTTGRGNYEETGEHMGVDLVANPELLRTPRYAIMSACVEWKRRGCNELADKRQLRATRKKINGGYNGMAHVEAFYSQVMGWLPDGFRLDNSPAKPPVSSATFAEMKPDLTIHVPDTVMAVDAGSPAWIEEADMSVPGSEKAKNGAEAVPGGENAPEQPETAGMKQTAEQITNVLPGAGSAGSADATGSKEKMEAAALLPDTSITAKVKMGFNKMTAFVWSVITGTILIPEWIQNGISLDSIKGIGGLLWDAKYLIFGILALWFVVTKFESIFFRYKQIEANTNPEKGNVVLKGVEEPSLWTSMKTKLGG